MSGDSLGCRTGWGDATVLSWEGMPLNIPQSPGGLLNKDGLSRDVSGGQFECPRPKDFDVKGSIRFSAA